MQLLRSHTAADHSQLGSRLSNNLTNQVLPWCGLGLCGVFNTCNDLLVGPGEDLNLHRKFVHKCSALLQILAAGSKYLKP